MIDNCISVSEKINDLTLREAFIYTWIIPHLDDWGRVTGSPRKLKALIFPMKKEISINYIEKALIKFKEEGLFLWEDINGITVLQQPFEEFKDHQSISESKRAKSKYPEIIDTSQEMPRNAKKCQETPVQVNLSKEKRIKENINKTTYAEFVLMTKEEHQKLIDKYGKGNTDKFVEKLDNAKGANRKLKYDSDYRAILNWVVDAVVGADKKKEFDDRYKLGVKKEKDWQEEKRDNYKYKSTIPPGIKEQIHKVLNIPDKNKNIGKDK